MKRIQKKYMDNKNLDNNYQQFDLVLPKKLHGNREEKKIQTVLNSHLKPVEHVIGFIVPSFQLSEPIINSLYYARRTGRLVRGFEDSERKLNAEREGIANIDKKTGSERKERISRLIIIANDGSDRFYRQTKRLIEQNGPRVLAVYLDVTSFELGERLFGPGKRALFLLINHKDAVINFLTSLIR